MLQNFTAKQRWLLAAGCLLVPTLRAIVRGCCWAYCRWLVAAAPNYELDPENLLEAALDIPGPVRAYGEQGMRLQGELRKRTGLLLYEKG